MSSLCSRPVRSLLLARAPAYRFIAAACSLALLPLAPRRVIQRALTARACSQLNGTLHSSQWRQANFCVVYSRGIVRAKLPLWDQHIIRGGPHTGLAPPAIAQLNKGQRCSLADSTYPHTHFLQAPLDTSHPPLSLPTSPPGGGGDSCSSPSGPSHTPSSRPYPPASHSATPTVCNRTNP